ncbi:MAG: DUF1016 N-terminal domain-containing protein [Treponema sp.]|jgi:hypothetical protein|nr:DUF1016 N-terminal domain-containing protein [Treponema sp.]
MCSGCFWEKPYMRLFYTFFPICETVSHKLSWSHYCELVKLDDELERSFYYQQNILENWSVLSLSSMTQWRYSLAFPQVELRLEEAFWKPGKD